MLKKIGLRSGKNNILIKYIFIHKFKTPFFIQIFLIVYKKIIFNSFFNNCKVWKTKTFLSDSGNLKNGIVFNYPDKYRLRNIPFNFYVQKNIMFFDKDMIALTSQNNKHEIMI